ncbi:DUF4301 family protein [Sungkyunkwania multivorans]|uniref:DUF4301 family protein n=1 Tax=Sungkyunkwania multivorans TaxID=1173618 RepID=A0ABW3D096_9FLAO
MNFSPEDIRQIEAKGLTKEDVIEQINIFKKGIRYIDLKDAATLKNGVTTFAEEEVHRFVENYNRLKKGKSIVKFTPASGAASRMFKFLFDFLKEYDIGQESINSYVNKHKASRLKIFFIGLEKFPFYDQVLNYIQHQVGVDIKSLPTDEFRVLFVKTLLSENGLNFGEMPKGMLPFHSYKEHTATAFEEHLFEANKYICVDNKAKLHFTISPQHKKIFEKKQQQVIAKIEDQTDCVYDISYSFQEPYTDTIAVDMKNKPMRDANGALIFRPGGHGALIENLNDIDADIIFIKNVDNVVVNKYEDEIVKYKKLLGGYLFELQSSCFAYLMMLENTPQEVNLEEVLVFLFDKLNVRVNEEFEKYSFKYQIEYLIEKLNRPIRVCGMVKNEGEPGGGPFWVKHENGYVSLQIVENAQIDKQNEYQKKLFANATHFNPVDIVCGVVDYKGDKFNLKKFVDQKAYFIASKSKSGKKLKALERPGLWNGGMAFWNTAFVEVPLITFNPVKTVNDLLKPAHQKND